MPWKDWNTMSQREEFVQLAQAQEVNISSLCRRFGISRKSGYKWMERFAAGGVEGLKDRSRRPHHSVSRSSDDIEGRVISARQKHPAWGGRKLRRLLLDEGSEPSGVPTPSTIGRILLRHGLIDEAESARHRAFVRFEKEQPNELWQMDFKGHVPMLDGGRCHPLTVLDDHSRYNVGLIACGNERTETVKSALIGLLERYGQPGRILCDNGGPWGSCGAEPHTQLSVWLMLHGIGVSHGRPYHPQTQGKDERFHRTFKAELLSRRSLADLIDSQVRFDDWRGIYNDLRPHEALGMATPVTRWRPSERAFVVNPPPPEYPAGDAVRKVDGDGKLSFKGRGYKIGQAFSGQRVGLRASEVDGVMKVMLAEHEVGELDIRGQSESMCRAGAPVASLPGPRHGTEESVTHVPEQVSPMSPV
jgi:transposase InsO family protein